MCRSSRRCAASPLSEACAGTAFIDTVSITKANVKVLEDGDKWLVYNRKKTGTLARVKLLPEALELMAKYEDGARDTLFPLLNTNRVRIDLITICKLAETSKTYSYHSGRHSFASLITLEAGVPMETICKMLGHKDVKMTQRYARVPQKKAHPSFHLSQRCFLSFARLLKIVLKNIINKIITWIDVNNTK